MPVIPRSRRRFASLARGRPVGALLALAAVVLTLGTSGCASSAPATVPSSSGPKPSATLITADEIAHANVLNAYEVVQKLRPALLGQRQVASWHGQGGTAKSGLPTKGTDVTAGQVVVYMDGTRLGDVEQLRGITAASIATLRYYSASEAQYKWGSNHPAGVIEVVSKD